MATADVSAVSYLLPVFAYLLVITVAAAILVKLEILGSSKWLNIFAALLIGSIFISAVGARTYVTTVIPWFGVMLICLFLVLMVVGFVGKDVDFMKKGIGIVFVVMLGLIFLVSAFVVFSDVLFRFPVGVNTPTAAPTQSSAFMDWLYSPRVAGAVLLIIASAAASWILAKK